MGAREGVCFLVFAVAYAPSAVAATRTDTRRVTYSTPAATARQVCKDLGRLSGVRFQIGGQLANEVLAIDVKSVLVRALADRIAQVLHGRLRVIAGGYAIERPATLQAKLEAVDAAEGRAQAAKALAAARRRLSGFRFDRAGAAVFAKKLAVIAQESLDAGMVGYDDRFRWLEDHSPVARLLDRLVIALGEDHWAQLSTEDTERLIWPGEPRARAAVDAYRREQKVMAEAVTAALPNAARIMGSTETNRLAHPELIPPDARFELTLTKRTSWVVQGDLDIKSPSDQDLGSHRFDYAGAHASDKEWDNYAVGAWASGLGTFRSAPVATAEVLCNPETHDPLGFLAGPALRVVASQVHRSLVACLPDDALSWAELEGPDELNLNQFLRDLVLGGEVELHVDARWLLVEPQHPRLCERFRVDRAEIGTYLRESQSAGFISLDRLAEIHYRTHGRFDDFVGPAIRKTLSLPYEFDTVQVSHEFLDLLGSLSSAERAALHHGIPLQAVSLSSKQKGLLRAYWDSPRQVDPRRLFAKEKRAQLPPFPSTLSQDALLREQTVSVDAWVFCGPQGQGPYQVTPEFLAARDALVERKAKGWQTLATFTFYPVTKTVRTYTTDLGGGTVRTLSFERTGKPHQGSGVPRDKVVSSDDTEVSKLVSEYREFDDVKLRLILREAFMVSFER
jgi:hypothetical protein